MVVRLYPSGQTAPNPFADTSTRTERTHFLLHTALCTRRARCPVSGTAAASLTQTAALPLQRAGFLSRCRNTIRLQSCIHRDNVTDCPT